MMYVIVLECEVIVFELYKVNIWNLYMLCIVFWIYGELMFRFYKIFFDFRNVDYFGVIRIGLNVNFFFNVF